MSVPIDGGTPTTLASGQMAPEVIVVDSTSVYWTTASCALPDGGFCSGGTVMKLTPK
jgi:hypothetical protein